MLHLVDLLLLLLLVLISDDHVKAAWPEDHQGISSQLPCSCPAAKCAATASTHEPSEPAVLHRSKVMLPVGHMWHTGHAHAPDQPDDLICAPEL